MRTPTRPLLMITLGAALAWAGCAGSPGESPVSPTIATVAGEASVVSTLGNGPGGPAAPGTGTCAGSGDCTGGGQGPGYVNGPGSGLCGDACTGAVGPDPEDIGEMLGLAVQEEHKAEMLYRSVLEDYGPGTLPFATIAESEAHHLAALELLMTRRQLTPPASAWAPSDFPTFATLAAACAAGADAEIADAAFYSPYLDRDDLPQDVATVFANLQAASLQNHLPAFERCR
jgi:hypothetical protein